MGPSERVGLSGWIVTYEYRVGDGADTEFIVDVDGAKWAHEGLDSEA